MPYLYKCTYSSKLGLIYLIADECKLISLDFYCDKYLKTKAYEYVNPILKAALIYLEEYFKFKNIINFTYLSFDLSKYKDRVLFILHKFFIQKIACYQDVAIAYSNYFNKQTSSLAIGQVLAKNDILLIIPCHNIIYKNGDIGFYKAGKWRKHYLLSK